MLLHCDGCKRFLDAVNRMAELGTAVDVADKEGQTPLSCAAMCEHHRQIVVLLRSTLASM